jgi:putative oxidoreductase
MTTTEKSADLLGRILIAAMFVGAGVPKIGAYHATQVYMASAGVPGALLPAVIALEVLGGIALIVGYRTRVVAISLAAFTVLAAFLFHGASDQMQQVMFMKNLAIAGGLLILASRGAAAWSLDARNARLSAPGDVLRSS